jgi:hypothetical protein
VGKAVVDQLAPEGKQKLAEPVSVPGAQPVMGGQTFRWQWM